MCGAAAEKNQAGNIKRMKNGMKKIERVSERASEGERQWSRPTRQAQGPTKGQRQTGRLIDRAYICLTQHKNESKSYKKNQSVCARVCVQRMKHAQGKTLRTSLAGAQKDSSMAIPKLQAKVWTSTRMMRRVQSKHKYGTSRRRRGTLTIPTLSPQRGLSQQFLF